MRIAGIWLRTTGSVHLAAFSKAWKNKVTKMKSIWSFAAFLIANFSGFVKSQAKVPKALPANSFSYFWLSK
ncbi:hypothetical protein NG797_16330 [Laspinema sp. D5]|nr:hypothetical protein [Laspinema sp. D3d]